MALSEPAARQPAHRRTITLDGFARDDGHFDIEAELVDIKHHSFPRARMARLKKAKRFII